MYFNRKTLFNYVRRSPFGGKLTQQQVDGINDCLDYFEDRPKVWNDIRHIAYYFATTQHETGGRMVPVRETFAKTSAQAVRRLDAALNAGRLPQVKTRYWKPNARGISYHGRGRNQVTWEDNYKFVEEKTGLPVVDNPDLLLDSATDCEVSIPALMAGWWTRGAHKLPDYFDATKDDSVNARRIVNGTDKAKHIAENLYEPWLKALQAAEETTPQPEDVTDEDAKPDGKKASESTTVFAAVGTALAGGGASVFAAIDNPYALGFAVVCVVCAAWIIRERMRHAYEDGA